MSIYRGRSRKDFSLAASLYDSIADNDFRGVSLLIEKGADANIVLQKTGISPFHLVIGNDCADFALKTIKLILQHGGNPNIQSDEGLTPLHIAAAWGRIEVVELLLNCGADPEIRDSNYMIPLDYAIEYKHVEIAKLLHKFMYSGPTELNAKENEDYQLLLDKVIVSNGTAEAEYEVDSGKGDSSSKSSSVDSLLHLPQTTPDEYVRNWCRTHAVETHLSGSKPQSELELKNTKYKAKHSESNLSDVFNSNESDKFNNIDFPFVNSEPRNVNKNVVEKFSLSFEISTKYKSRKTASSDKKGVDIPAIASSFCKHTEGSRESGIATLPDTTQDINSVADDLGELTVLESKFEDLNISNKDDDPNEKSAKNVKDTSSDYFTCNEMSGSINILERNICNVSSVSFAKNSLHSTKCSSVGLNCGNEITDLNGVTNVPCNVSENPQGLVSDESFVSITEVYKYVDNQEGVVLYEKRLLVNQKSVENESNVSPIQSVQSSKLSSLPASFDYDTDTLRNELTQRGFDPGPITRTTKRLYLRKLRSLQKHPSICKPTPKIELQNAVYSMELEKTFKNPNWMDDLSEYKVFEDVICKEFSNPDPSRKWREGVNKASFTYLLLDPRITNNLPGRAESMSLGEIWQTFISSIFYIGKGKRSRPYSHLYEAAALWRENNKNTNKKLQHILSIWNDNCGVVCLHVFQNVIPVEAYTREAAMIKALKIDNIKNLKSGDFYGTAATWSSHQQKMLGVLLLYKAMLIFLNEGERQLRPADIN